MQEDIGVYVNENYAFVVDKDPNTTFLKNGNRTDVLQSASFGQYARSE